MRNGDGRCDAAWRKDWRGRPEDSKEKIGMRNRGILSGKFHTGRCLELNLEQTVKMR